MEFSKFSIYGGHLDRHLGYWPKKIKFWIGSISKINKYDEFYLHAEFHAFNPKCTLHHVICPANDDDNDANGR